MADVRILVLILVVRSHGFFLSFSQMPVWAFFLALIIGLRLFYVERDHGGLTALLPIM